MKVFPILRWFALDYYHALIFIELFQCEYTYVFLLREFVYFYSFIHLPTNTIAVQVSKKPTQSKERETESDSEKLLQFSYFRSINDKFFGLHSCKHTKKGQFLFFLNWTQTQKKKRNVYKL